MTPAPVGARAIAGAIDTAVVLALCGVYFLVPLLTRGLVLPMWGVLAAILGYLVVPLSAFKQTLGMRLLNLELVTKDGHAVGPGDVLFRELLGRGFFPAAFLFTIFAGLVAGWLGIARFAAPTGIALLFFFASAVALGVAVLGHLLILSRDDRRSVADLMARSFVRVAPPPAAPPTDAEELADLKAERSKKLRGVVLFEVALVVAAVALPWVLTQKTETKEEYAARLQRQKLEAEAKATPDDERVLSELARAYAREGRVDDAAELQRRFDAAQAKHAAERVEKLKAAVAANPKDERALAELLDVYDDAQDWDAAKAAYRRFLDASEDHELRAGFGRWLWRRRFHEEAIAEVKEAQQRDPAMEGVHSLLGRIMADCDRLEEAQTELALALQEDPEDEEAKAVFEVLNEELGPLPPAKLKALKSAAKPR